MGRKPSELALGEIVAQIRALLAHADPDLVQIGRLIQQAHAAASIDAIHEQCGLGLRKTYDLMAIAGAVGAGLLTSVEVRKIGWSKARAVATHSRSRAEARRVVAFAQKATSAALVAYLRDGGDGRALITKSFHLTAAQARRLDAALAAAGVRMQNKTRMANRSEALMRIVDAYRPGSARKGRG